MRKSLKHHKIIGKASIQGSDEWLEWRKKFRSASKSSTVFGVNPFETMEEMKKRELNLLPPIEINSEMLQGNEREQEVLEKAENFLDTRFFPECWQYDKYSASLDGIDSSGKIVVELKVSQYTYDQINEGHIPIHYKIQVMHQLLCSGAEIGYLISMNPIDGKIAISSMIKMESNFYEKLEKAWNKYDKLIV